MSAQQANESKETLTNRSTHLVQHIIDLNFKCFIFTLLKASTIRFGYYSIEHRAALI